MTKPISATEQGLKPHYKVRVVLPAAILHVASWTEPRCVNHQTRRYEAEWITDPLYGDSIGFINWHRVVAVTWRWASPPNID
jgi:hypothetical protein